MTDFDPSAPAIFHACHLVQPSDRGEYELPDAVDLLIQSGRTIDAIRMDGWRIDVGYPDPRGEGRPWRPRGCIGLDRHCHAPGGVGNGLRDVPGQNRAVVSPEGG